MAAGNVDININLITRQAQENADALSRSVIGLNSTLEILEKTFNLTARALTSISSFFADALDSAAKFNTGLVEIGTVAGDVDLDKLGTDLIAVSNQFGLTLEDVRKGYYDLVSAGVAVEDATIALDVASKLATTGFTSQAVAVNAVTGVMNAWGLKASDLALAGDTLAITVKKGKLTFEEYSGAIGNVSPAAAGLGISLQQTSAAIAALTLGNKTASEAATSLKTVLEGLAKPSKELEVAFKASTGQTVAQALATGDLTKIFDGLAKASGGNTQAMLKLFGSFEAGQAAVSLTGKQLGAFKDALNEMENAAKSAGSVLDKDFASVADSAGFKMKQAKEQFANLFTDLGKYLLPAAAAVASSLSEVAGNIATFVEENKKGIKAFSLEVAVGIKEAFVQLKEFLNLLYDNRDTIKTLAAGLAAGAIAFQTYTIAVKAATLASTAFTALQAAGGIAGIMTAAINPAALLAVAIGALVASIIWLNDNMELAGGTFLQFQADIENALIPVVTAFAELGNYVAKAYINAAAIVSSRFISLEASIGSVISSIGAAIVGLINYLKPLDAALGGTMQATLNSITGGITSLSNALKDKAAADAAKGMEVYSGALKAVDGFTNGLIKSQKDAAASSQSLANAAMVVYNETMAKNEAQKASVGIHGELAKATVGATKPTKELGKTLTDTGDAGKAAADKIKELAGEVANLQFQSKNIGKAVEIINSDEELKRIADILGSEKAATSVVEQLRLKSIGKVKEADLLRAKLTAEAGIKAAQDEAKARAESDKASLANFDNREANYRKNFDSFAKTETDIVDQTAKDILAITKVADDAAAKLAESNIKTSEDNMARREANYRTNWDSFAKTETEIQKTAQEDITKIVEEQDKKRIASAVNYLGAINNIAQGMKQAFEGVSGGVEALSGGDLAGGLAQSVQGVVGGIGTSLGSSIGPVFTQVANSFVSLISAGLATTVNSLKTAFSLVSGAFIADLASGVAGILASFSSTVDALEKGTEALNTFGNTSEKAKKVYEDEAKQIEDNTKAKIDAVAKEVDAKNEAISKTKSKESDAIRETFAAKIEALKRQQEQQAAVDADALKAKNESIKAQNDAIKEQNKANKDFQVEAIAAAEGLTAVQKEARKNANEDAIKALERERDAKLGAIKGEVEALGSVKEARIKAVEAEAEVAATALKKRIADEEAARKASGGVFGDIAKTVDEFAEAFANKMPDIIDSFVTNLPKMINSVVKAIPKIVAALVKGIPEIIKALAKGIPDIMKALLAAIPQVTDALLKELPGFLRAVVDLLPQLITALLNSLIAALPIILPAIINLVANVILAIIEKIPLILDEVLKVIPLLISKIPILITALLEAIPGIIDVIVNNLPAIIQALVKAIPEIIGAIIENIPLIVGKIIERLPDIAIALVEGIISLFGNLVSKLWESIGTGIANFVGSLWSSIKNFDIVDWIASLGTRIWNGLQDAFRKFGDWLAEVGGAVWDGIKGAFEEFGDWLADVGMAIWTGIGDAFLTAGDWLAKVGESIWLGLKNAVSGAWNWFGDIGRAIWDGLKGAMGNIGDWFSDTGNSIGDAIAGVFGWADGGVVEGKAVISGDSLKNDTVPAMLSPGEMVIPRSAMSEGLAGVMRFAADQMGATRMAAGGIISSNISGANTPAAGGSSELAALRAEIREIGAALTRSTANMDKVLTRWNGDGLPNSRGY